jgi:hypothetical protein
MTALRKRQSALPVVLASVLLLGSGAVVQVGETERVSVNSAGTQGNGSSFAPVALQIKDPHDPQQNNIVPEEESYEHMDA